MGRPTKLDPERAQRLVDALATGCHIETACALAGIGTSTYFRWMDRGAPLPDDTPPPDDDPDAPYREFRDRATRALAQAEAAMVQVLADAARGENGYDRDWRAAEALLRRRFPGRWNVAVQRLEHSGAAAGSASLSEEERLAERMHGFLQGAAAALDVAEREQLPALPPGVGG